MIYNQVCGSVVAIIIPGTPVLAHITFTLHITFMEGSLEDFSPLYITFMEGLAIMNVIGARPPKILCEYDNDNNRSIDIISIP